MSSFSCLLHDSTFLLLILVVLFLSLIKLISLLSLSFPLDLLFELSDSFLVASIAPGFALAPSESAREPAGLRSTEFAVHDDSLAVDATTLSPSHGIYTDRVSHIRVS